MIGGAALFAVSLVALGLVHGIVLIAVFWSLTIVGFCVLASALTALISDLVPVRQRGFVYTIAVIDRRGDDGRLVIDARTGRILRFMPAYYRMGDNPVEDMPAAYGPPGAPPISPIRGGPRPPAPIPHLASRTPSSVPLPKASPPHAAARPLAAAPPTEPARQQSAAVEAKPADASPAPAATVGQAKPAAQQILPTQPMPKVMGLD